MKLGVPKKKGDFRTDGVAYFVYGNMIAKRIEPPINLAVAHKLLTGENLIEFAYRFPSSGQRSIISNHLRMFPRIYAYEYSKSGPHINGKTVKHDQWYTEAEIDALPEDEDLMVPATPVCTARRDELTLEMFA